jgi:hypothetical protein
VSYGASQAEAELVGEALRRQLLNHHLSSSSSSSRNVVRCLQEERGNKVCTSGYAATDISYNRKLRKAQHCLSFMGGSTQKQHRYAGC